MILRLLTALAAVAALAVSAPAFAAQTPKGSITIERISHIKYPSAPAWSPDGGRIAFLWDAWGKQDLFVVSPGAAPGMKPVALTDFPVDPDIRTSDISAFAWLSNSEILFTKDGVLYSVAADANGKPARYGAFADAANFTLSPDKTLIAFTRAGQVWFGSTATKVQRQVTNLAPQTAGAPVFSADGGKVAFVVSGGGGPAAPETMGFNGTRMAVVGSPNPNRVGNIGAVERKIAVASVFGGDLSWIPVSGNPSAVQFTANGVLWAETSADGKTREIKVAKDGTTRTLWKDHDERWFTPTGRDSKVLVSPDGKSVAFISDRSGWIHVYVMGVDGSGPARQLTKGDYLVGLGA